MIAYQTAALAYQGAGQFAYQESSIAPPAVVIIQDQIRGQTGAAASRRLAIEEDDAELVAILAALFSQKRD